MEEKLKKRILKKIKDRSRMYMRIGKVYLKASEKEEEGWRKSLTIEEAQRHLGRAEGLDEAYWIVKELFEIWDDRLRRESLVGGGIKINR